MKTRKINSSFAYSLIEVLVVVAVLSILTLLFIGYFKSWFRNTQDTQCITNLRKIGVASIQYFADNNGALFPYVFWYTLEDYTLNYIGLPSAKTSEQSIKRDTVFTCPTAKDKYPDMFNPAIAFNRTYSLNFYGHLYSPNDQQSSDPERKQNPNRLFPGNVYAIGNPSAMWLFMDGATKGGYSSFFTYLTHGHIPYLSSPHQGESYAVFFDGHVQRVTTDQMRQPYSSEFWGGPPQ